MRRLLAFRVAIPASSAAVISSPGGLPRAPLMAASKFASGKVTITGVVGVSVVEGVGVSGIVSWTRPGCQTGPHRPPGRLLGCIPECRLC